MTRFIPNQERELPLAQWSYELALQGLIGLEIEIYMHYIKVAVSYPRWRWIKQRYYQRLATQALLRRDKLRAELHKEEQATELPKQQAAGAG